MTFSDKTRAPVQSLASLNYGELARHKVSLWLLRLQLHVFTLELLFVNRGKLELCQEGCRKLQIFLIKYVAVTARSIQDLT